jgi:hypothetical protein
MSVLKRRRVGSDGLVQIAIQEIVDWRLPDSWGHEPRCMAVWTNFLLHEYNIFSNHYGLSNSIFEKYT